MGGEFLNGHCELPDEYLIIASVLGLDITDPSIEESIRIVEDNISRLIYRCSARDYIIFKAQEMLMYGYYGTPISESERAIIFFRDLTILSEFVRKCSVRMH